ncbi:MAG TPA: type IV pilus modification protein PilV [Woeseiaceae bacterium]|nr:type IV pilus modification protein PilV [Woeseiaceae bacterium]
MNGNPPPRTTGKSVGGFSLVEVLIALIVMSVGMLGIAGLYVHGMQAGRTSLFRHQAVLLAGDVADRIRANPDGGAAYEGAGADNGCVGGTIDCNAAEMAANDILLWLDQAAATLPDGQVAVVYTNGVPSTYRVTVTWSEAGDTPSYEIEFPVFEM